MITLDKLKIVADVEAIKVCDEARFEFIEKNGVVSSLKYYQEHPFLLMIKVDYECREVVIEFCGKILGKNYPKLISKDTIRQCFQAIDELGFVEVDIDAMMEAEVDVQDVSVEDGEMTVKTSFQDFGKAQETIENLIPNVEFDTCEATMLPNEYVELTDPEDIEAFHKLMDMLNEVDDVNKIYTNAKLPEE